MNTSSSNFVTVEMRGLKSALVARAHADRVSVSVLVRKAVARDLGLADEGEHGRADVLDGVRSSSTSIKLSIRMTATEGRQLAAGARAAGLSRGAYLAGLIANVPVLAAGGGRAEHIAALMASSAELSTLGRNIHRLTALLRQAKVEPARPYRAMLETQGADIQRHLVLASRVLAELQPARRGTGRSIHGPNRSRASIRRAPSSPPDGLEGRPMTAGPAPVSVGRGERRQGNADAGLRPPLTPHAEPRPISPGVQRS